MHLVLVIREKPLIVVTGSSGRIGSALLRALGRAYERVGFDREGPPAPAAEADCVFVDLTSDESVQNAFTHLRLDHGRDIASVVHLAAHCDLTGAPSDKYEEVTVGGTERFLRELQDCRVGQFIFTSSMLVHAPCRPGEAIDEEWPVRPRWSYPDSKAKAERLIRERRGSIPSIFLRLAGVYDDRCRCLPLARQIQRIYERRLAARVFPGQLAHGQASVHLDDAVRAIVLAVEQRDRLGPEEVLLIGEPVTESYGALQEEIGRLVHGEAWRTHPIPKPVAKFGTWFQDLKPWMVDRADEHYTLDVGRAKRRLGWEPRRTLRTTLPEMVRSLKAAPLAWYAENHLRAPSWIGRRSAG